MQRKLSQKVADYKTAVLGLSCLLPLLVVFSIGQNIDAQGLILILTGLLAWYGVWLSRRQLMLPRSIFVLAAIYIGSCVLSLLVHPNLNNLIGSPLIRLGSLTLIACVGCGLLLSSAPVRHLLLWLYMTAVIIAAFAVMHSLFTIHHLQRLGGVFNQADILGIWMAVGFVLGIGLWQMYPAKGRWLAAAQLLLLAVLFLSQTRAVIVILAIVLCLMIVRAKLDWQRRLGVILGLAAGLAVGTLISQAVLPHRLTDVGYASESVSYRLSLQGYGLKATTKEPLWGYGAGSLPTALACPTLHSPALQKTCHEGHYFDSSHNIFLDRLLGLGWLGGLAFFSFVITALVAGLKNGGSEQYFTYSALLISLYYFTNVTSLTVELLLWIFLWRSWSTHAY